VEVHRHRQFGTDVPQRIPVGLGEIGEPVGVWTGTHVDAAQTETVGASDLVHRHVDIPHRRDRHREHPLARFVLQFGRRVVVDLDRQSSQLLVGIVDEPLTAEADRVRVHDLGPHPVLVHELESRRDLPRALMDALVPQTHETHAQMLRPVAVDHR